MGLNDFRPISLASNLYKIISKVLANRFRLVMVEVVSGNQFGFIKGKQILDYVLIAREIID